ncbi:MAG: SRPBCC domain-containing protein [Sphingomonadaceae bacterium]|nr:SRPBCC domain-containing protein [Sphingomonadaceae bacterium]
MTSNDTQELSVEIYIDAPTDHVWTLMTEHQEKWWCPKPWRVEVVEQDWRAGGRAAMTMFGPNGETNPIEGIFLEVIAGRRFVTTDAITADMQPAGPFMIGIWEITPEGAGTRYRASARHWDAAARERHREMGFEAGWMACAEQLKALAEGGQA